MIIGLIDVDSHSHFPSIPLMKLSRWHKEHGDHVEFYTPFSQYDRVYMCKIFTFTPDYNYAIPNTKEIIKGGTGYDFYSSLPPEIERMQPDYYLYPWIDSRMAYGKLTSGCPNKCHWCIVPSKEGMIKPYMDIEDLTIEKRNRIVLIDNNFIASGDYAKEQLNKIIHYGFRIDLNQANDARLVTRNFAHLLAKTKWINNIIRFGCDTKSQIEPCERTIRYLQESGFKGCVELYTMIHGSLMECYERISRWRDINIDGITIRCQSQPMLNLSGGRQNIPQWAKDMARWSNRKELYASFDFLEYIPRKDFICKKYFLMGNLKY